MNFVFVCLTVHHKRFTLSDFHQEVAFNQYFYLHQPFIFLCACLSICLSVCFFGVFDEQIFIKSFVGRTWPKEEATYFGESSGSHFG